MELVTLDISAIEALQPGMAKTITAAFKLLTHLATINDRRVTQEFKEAMDDITVETAAKLDRMMPALERMLVDGSAWKDEPEHTRPTRDDVLARLVDYARAHQRAGHHGKRRILWNAFFASFDPKFYKDGLAAHLWRIAAEVHYPELRFLKEFRTWEESLGRTEARQPPRGQPVTAPPHTPGSMGGFFVERLRELGLVVEHRTSVCLVRSTEVAARFVEFVWDDDMWNLDGEPGRADASKAG